MTLVKMVDGIDPGAIAARIRGLIGGQDRGLLAAAAQRLLVTEVALRISVDELEPHPALDVLAALVRVYGVDPTWLLTGEYDAATHRAALDDENESGSSLAQLIASRLSSDNRNRSAARAFA